MIYMSTCLYSVLHCFWYMCCDIVKDICGHTRSFDILCSYDVVVFVWDIVCNIRLCRFKNKLQTWVCRKGAVGQQDMSPSSYALLIISCILYNIYMFIHLITYIVVVRYCLLLGTMMSSTYMPWAKTNHLPQFQDTDKITYVVRLLNMESWSNSLMIELFCCYLLQQFR